MTDAQCYFFHFGLIVTGDAEEEHITKLFKSLMALGICSFEVIRKIDQCSPITSQNKQAKMAGIGQTIPNKDAEDIGFPTRRYLKEKPCSYVILIDDLEHNRSGQAQQIYERYRQAFDEILKGEKHRASVHFLVNMLEAYYFANAQAINKVLGTSLTNFDGDVETIRHPKGKLKREYHEFKEIEDGGKILNHLDVEYILSNPEACASLRTLFGWCLKCMGHFPNDQSTDKYRLLDEKSSEITRVQLENII